MSRTLRMLLMVLLCVALILGALPFAPARAAQLDTAAIDQYVTDLLKLYDVPGAGIALIKNDQVVYAKGYGVRDIETKEPVTENTVFAIGSVTKSFTALAVAQLVDAGKVNLDDPVIKYVPDFKLADPEATKTLTIRHILSHTSGLPRADELWYSEVPKDRQQVIADMAKITPTAKPGERWQYNNQNFALAGYIVEKVTGQSWESYVQEHIFQPLGMKTADVNVTQMQQAADYSMPHQLDVRKGLVTMPFTGKGFLGVVPLAPAGAINASPMDMAQYVRFQLGDGMFNGQRIVSAKLLKEMHSKQIAIEGNTGIEALQPPSVTSNPRYGFGWFLETYRNYEVVEHGGNIDGFSANVTLVPSEKVGLVALSNINGEGLFMEALRLRLVEFLLGLKSEGNLPDIINRSANFDPATRQQQIETARTFKPDPAVLDKLTGDYDSPLGKASAYVKDGKFYLKIAGQPELELVPFANDSFLLTGGSLSSTYILKFTTDAQGTIKVSLNGLEIAQRLGKDVKAIEYKDPKGRFIATLPQGFEAQAPVGDIGVYTSKAPAGIIRVGALPAGDNPVEASVKQWVSAFRPGFDLKPTSVNDAKLPNGVTWTQYLYVLPDGQILAVLVTKQNDTLYFGALECKVADAQRLTLPLVSVLQSFQFPA